MGRVVRTPTEIVRERVQQTKPFLAGRKKGKIQKCKMCKKLCKRIYIRVTRAAIDGAYNRQRPGNYHPEAIGWICFRHDPPFLSLDRLLAKPLPKKKQWR